MHFSQLDTKNSLNTEIPPPPPPPCMYIRYTLHVRCYSLRIHPFKQSLLVVWRSIVQPHRIRFSTCKWQAWVANPLLCQKLFIFMDTPDIDRAQLSYGRFNFTRQKDKLLQHVHAEHWQVNGPCPARTSVGNIFSMKTIIEWTRQGPPLRVDVFPSRKTERQRCGGRLAKWTSLTSCLKSSSGSPFLKGRFWCPQKVVTRTWPLFIRKPQRSRILL